jgi:hypothetical protein
VLTAVYLLNRVPCKANDGQTSLELWYGKKLFVHHLKIFGSVMYVRNTRPNLKKLEDRGRRMIVVGYERGTKAYRVYDPATKKVTITHDLVFDEAVGWDWTGDTTVIGGGDQGVGDLTVQYGAWPGGAVTPEEAEAKPHTPQVEPASPRVIDAPALPVGDYGKPAIDEENLDTDHDNAPLRLRATNDIIRAAPTPSFAERALGTGGGDHLFMISTEEPSSVTQVAQETHWRTAMEEELHAIEENKTWVLTYLPPGRQAIGLKWVFRVKKNEHGVAVWHKALVVKGYAQCQGIDFEEVYVLVACLEAVRLLLALADHEGWQVHHMDVKTTFLNGNLH